MECEICGRECEKTKRVEIDRSEFEVCLDCAKHGRELEQEHEIAPKVEYVKKAFTEPKIKFDDSGLVADYGQRIRRVRTRKNLTLKDLAAKIYEKESYLHRVEAQSTEPTDAVVKKLEDFLNIKLVKKAEGD